MLARARSILMLYNACKERNVRFLISFKWDRHRFGGTQNRDVPNESCAINRKLLCLAGVLSDLFYVFVPKSKFRSVRVHGKPRTWWSRTQCGINSVHGATLANRHYKKTLNTRWETDLIRGIHRWGRFERGNVMPGIWGVLPAKKRRGFHKIHDLLSEQSQ